MSAFSAIQNSEEIFYAKNSSDEESAVEEVYSNEEIEATPGVLNNYEEEVEAARNELVFSKYILGPHNTIFNETSVVFGLQQNETLIIKGQCKFKVVRGCAVIDGVPYDCKCKRAFSIFAPTSHSLPEISVRASPGTVSGNDKIFETLYPMVIELCNVQTGLENIGMLCPPFKNLFHNCEVVAELGAEDLNFTRYSFCPILKPVWDLNVTRITPETASLLDSFVSESSSVFSNASRRKLVVIGYKNAGKSTLVKTLLNKYLENTKFIEPVGILDLDPGQPEFSLPNSVLYSSHTDPIVGNPLATQQHMYQSFTNEYFGFNSPMENTEWYLRLVDRVYKRYQKGDWNRQVPLLVNMPGWVKGYGIELVYKILKIIKPTDIIYLKNSTDSDDELLAKLKHSRKLYLNDINILTRPGITVPNNGFKYSSQELSTLKILAYFHKHGTGLEHCFDFAPLLLSSPEKVSYLHSNMASSAFQGICGVIVANDDELGVKQDEINKLLELENVLTILDCSIVAVYAIDYYEYQALSQHEKNRPETHSPAFISFNKFQDIPDNNTTFLGLAIIHSTNTKTHQFNIYTTPQFSIQRRALEDVTLAEDGVPLHKLVFVRGRTSVPVWEIYPLVCSSLLAEKKTKLFKNKKIPFISINDKFGLGGKVIKIRRNIARRRLSSYFSTFGEILEL